MSFFATCPKGLESLLMEELTALGATHTKETRAGVNFDMPLDGVYRVCMWSRLANQIYLPLITRSIRQVDDLYHLALRFPWEEHMTVANTFAIDVDLIDAPFQNNQYAMQRFKDGLADYWRKKCGERPDVDVHEAHLRFHVLVKRNEVTLNLNLAGESLHKRGYRLTGGKAPLKENLAAAILIRAGWPAMAKDGMSLFDPLCGSGTLLIEGALIAADIAPGLLRDNFGFIHWQDFKPALWKKLKEEAIERREKGLANMPKIIGYDADRRAILNAQENIERAGLADYIQVEVRELSRCENLNVKPGLVMANPPYGERLGEKEELKETYGLLGNILKQHFSDWRCSVFTANVDLAKALRLGPDKIYKLFNGSLPCQLLNFVIRAPRTKITDHFID